MNATSASSLSTSLRQVYLTVSYCLGKIFCTTNYNNTSSLQKFIATQLLNTNNGKSEPSRRKSKHHHKHNDDDVAAVSQVEMKTFLPLDPLSRWNLTILICASLLTKGINCNKRHVFDKFIAYQKVGTGLLALGDLIPLTSNFAKYRE